MSLRAGRQEVDSINVPQAVVGLVAAISMVVLTIIGVYATTHNINWTEAQTSNASKAAPEVPKYGMLHQTLFGAHSDAADLRKEQLERLTSYGWVDEAKGVAHIPIQIAEQRLMEGSRK